MNPCLLPTPNRRPPVGAGRVANSLALAFALTCLATGCSRSGTPPPNPDAAKKESAEKDRPPLEVGRLTPLLSESLVATQDGQPQRLAKPGHWATAVQAMRANGRDFEGRTHIEAVDEQGVPVPLAHAPFRLSIARPAVLAKGVLKRIAGEVLMPVGGESVDFGASLLDAASGAPAAPSVTTTWSAMPSNQYFIVVLAREPGRYGFLRVTDSVRAPFEDEYGESPPHFQVVLADADQPSPLPASALAWTSVAYLVWDEVDLDRIDSSQQQALIDWLHWGGRLIVNGPDSLDALRSSFLASYLPADSGATRQVAVDELVALSDAWGNPPGGTSLPPIAVTRTWSGIELRPRAGAVELAGGNGLFYERSVGAGSILVSAIQLAERELVDWPAFDAFLNGALLRRPARNFRAETDAAWTNLQTDWAEFVDRAHDAYFTTPLRWFSRDAGTEANSRSPAPLATPSPAIAPGAYARANPSAGIAAPENAKVVDRPGGLGAWNDFGPVANAARTALRDAAGIRVPGAGFVVVCLAAYLAILALNWAVFHAIGRIEWAWIAAPVIAVLGTLLIVRQAQLDIGFVRSQTDIAVLELHGDYPRGHLSRYTALYSSLSASYAIEFDEPTALATPFPAAATDASAKGEPAEIVFESLGKPRLRGIPVSSASTQFVHSEQIMTLPGAVRLGSPSNNPKLKQFENGTGLTLSDAVVVRRRFDRNGNATDDACWLGEIRSGASALLSWTPLAMDGSLPYAAKRDQAARESSASRLNIDGLLQLAFEFPTDADPIHRRRDEYRLVARVDEPIRGAQAVPAASQTVGAAVVLAHLELAPQQPPRPDLNSPDDVAPNRNKDLDSELDSDSVE